MQFNRLCWPGFKTQDPVAPQRAQGPVAPGVGDRGLSPPQQATGSPLFFSLGTSLQIYLKKITFEPCRPPIGRPGYIFEIFQNRHIFLKF